MREQLAKESRIKGKRLTQVDKESGVRLNNASDYQTNGLYQTPNPKLNPHRNPSLLVQQSVT